MIDRMTKQLDTMFTLEDSAPDSGGGTCVSKVEIQ